MSKSISKAIILGNCGRQPEIKTVAGGKKVAKFSVATSLRKNGADVAQWHNVICWDKLADVVEQYVHVGDRLYVEGRLEYSTFESKGETKHWTEIVAYEIVMLGGKERPAAVAAPAADPFADSDSDLPFG